MADAIDERQWVELAADGIHKAGGEHASAKEARASLAVISGTLARA
jgi:hypothetical protein